MAEITQRLSTALADRYRLDRQIGQGGMATVYLAHDLKHNRKVALKVLRPELAAVIGAERFLQEIEVTANLQHPHILTLHDSGDADSFLYYVMPFVEGESLREKLDREKQLSIEEGVKLAIAVASALDHAHRHNVIHRDIKPANVLLQDGQATVADFGIALAVHQAGGTRLTETGLSIGTPHYMSPEQAMGDRELDARSDVYSLGAMLYEMLASDPPYTGSTAQAIVAKVITEKAPSITAVRDTVPPNVASAIAQSLNKLPADRFASAAQFAQALENPAFRSTASPQRDEATPAAATAKTARLSWMPWAAAAATLVVGLAIGGKLRPSVDESVYRFTLRTEGFTNQGMDIASDGSFIVYSASDTLGVSRLFLRYFNELESRRLPGTEGGLSPSLSPDDQHIAYVMNRTSPTFGIYRVSVAGTPPVEISPIELLGITWGSDDYLYLADPVEGVTARMPSAGGDIELLVEPDTAAYSATHLWHDVLPGAKGVVFSIVRTDERLNDVGILDLNTREVRVLARGTAPKYVPSGYLLYASFEGTLFRRPFDVDRMEFTGPAESVVSGLWVPGFGFANVMVSENGTLVYQPSVATGTAFGRTLTGYAPDAGDFGRRIVLVDRNGTGRVLPLPRQAYNNVAVSPDGSRLVLEVLEGAADGGHLLMMGFDDSIPGRFTSDGIDTYPVWTRDGTRVAFSRFANNVRDLYWKPADGSGREEPIFQRDGAEFEIQFTPDDSLFIYRFGNASLGDDLALRYWDDREPDEHPTFLDLPGAAERAHKLSPDGRWLAYVSDKTGEDRVYVRPFPDDGSGAVYQVSTGVGTEPVWSPRGGELFYKERGALTVATVFTAPSFSVSERRRLFSVSDYWNNQNHARYDVMPDGQSFVMIGVTSSSGTGIETVVVTNWLSEIEKSTRR